MPATLTHIEREELWEKLQRGDEFVLVDALSPMSYALSHLPGAINITPAWVDDRARRRIPDLGTEVVVYCSGATCDASVEVATRLIELGYRNVRHFTDGKSAWIDAGFPLETGRS
jgi:rhodanese-related sulfurtransferase